MILVEELGSVKFGENKKPAEVIGGHEKSRRLAAAGTALGDGFGVSVLRATSPKFEAVKCLNQFGPAKFGIGSIRVMQNIPSTFIRHSNKFAGGAMIFRLILFNEFLM